jgi:uncharacterized CHY-type Zn-finger protein
MFTTETDAEAHVKTDHSQTKFYCNKCHETFNSQAFQQEHTCRITNIFTICDQIELYNERTACTMCGRRIANKEDLKKHMIFKAAKGNIDAKFLVNASTKNIS